MEGLENLITQMRYYKNTEYIIDCEIHGLKVKATASGKCLECFQFHESKMTRELIEQKRINRLKAAGVGSIYHNADLDNLKPSQSSANAFKNYKFDKNIVLIGTTGSGKSYVASALIAKAIENECYFIKFYALTDIKINDYKRYQKLLDSYFLVLDDFGVHDTDFKGAIIYEIFDYRYENRLPTMITTNLNADQLRTRLSDALYSRIKSSCLSIVMNGRDLRFKG